MEVIARCVARRDRHAARSASRTSRRTTSRRCAAGAHNFEAATRAARRRSATTSASGGCGGCTSPTARPASPSGGSASCSCAGQAGLARAIAPEPSPPGKLARGELIDGGAPPPMRPSRIVHGPGSRGRRPAARPPAPAWAPTATSGRPVLDRLAAHREVVAVDLPGFGARRRCRRRRPTPAALARAVAAGLRPLGVERSTWRATRSAAGSRSSSRSPDGPRASPPSRRPACGREPLEPPKRRGPRASRAAALPRGGAAGRAASADGGWRSLGTAAHPERIPPRRRPPGARLRHGAGLRRRRPRHARRPLPRPGRHPRWR